MTPLLDIRDLVVHFNTVEGVVHAVNGASYKVESGETLGIVGESGCGKSVSVLSILGLIQQPPGEIVSGSILFRDTDLLEKSEKELESIRGSEIGMVFQDPMTSLNPVLTIGRQINESMVVHLGVSNKEARDRGIELLETVGIPQAAERYDDYPHQFSGGMRQRVMIAAALACNPSILIADEPTTALDVTIQAQIIDLVQDLRDSREMAIIWITHDLAVIAEIADWVAVMYAGHVVEYAEVFDLFDNPLHPYTQSLLKSVPRIDQVTDEAMYTIPGSPLDCLHLPPGCSFAPRCTHAVARCLHEKPEPVELTGGHRVECWVDIERGEER